MVNKNLKSPIVISTLICSFLFYSGIFKIHSGKNLHCLVENSSICELYGEICSSPALLSNKKYYVSDLKVNKVVDINKNESSAQGNISIFIPENFVNSYLPGKLYTKSNSLKKAIWEQGGNYHIKGRLNGDIFYVEDLIDSYWPNSLTGRIFLLRAKGRVTFKRLMYSWKNAGGLFLALLCGSREYTETSISDSFRNAGLSHILALSGMHLSLLSGIAVFIGNKTKRIRVAYSIRLLALFIFVWFAGLSPSLTRAFICCLILIFSSLVNIRKPDMIQVLCCSFIIQTILFPQQLLNAGFLLSYGALFGILLLRKITSILFFPIFPKAIADSLTASTSAQFFTAPISMYLFKSVHPIGIIASVIVSPLITFFIYFGLFLFITSLIFPFFAQVSGIFMNLLYTVIIFFVNLFAAFPGINIS